MVHACAIDCCVYGQHACQRQRELSLVTLPAAIVFGHPARDWDPWMSQRACDGPTDGIMCPLFEPPLPLPFLNSPHSTTKRSSAIEYKYVIIAGAETKWQPSMNLSVTASLPEMVLEDCWKAGRLSVAKAASPFIAAVEEVLAAPVPALIEEEPAPVTMPEPVMAMAEEVAVIEEEAMVEEVPEVIVAELPAAIEEEPVFVPEPVVLEPVMAVVEEVAAVEEVAVVEEVPKMIVAEAPAPIEEPAVVPEPVMAVAEVVEVVEEVIEKVEKKVVEEVVAEAPAAPVGNIVPAPAKTKTRETPKPAGKSALSKVEEKVRKLWWR
jgi:hypothetical protein